MFIGTGRVIDLIGRGMGARLAKGLAVVALVFVRLGPASSSPQDLKLVIWDDAIISDSYALSDFEAVQLLYASEKLRAGERFTIFVPMTPGYKALCCVMVAAEESMSLEYLKKKYSRSIGFVRRLSSIKGAKHVYRAKFVPADGMNKEMKRFSVGSGETYFSAPAINGETRASGFDKDEFLWSGGLVKLTFQKVGNSDERYTLTRSGRTTTLQAERLPD